MHDIWLPGFDGSRAAGVQQQYRTQQRSNACRRGKVPSTQWCVKLPASDRHPVALIEEGGVDVRLAGIGKAFVAPSRAPAVAEDDPAIGPVPHGAHGMAAAYRC